MSIQKSSLHFTKIEDKLLMQIKEVTAFSD